jgi:hypothetical protein
MLQMFLWTDTEVERIAWLKALERARTWDGLASKDRVAEQISELLEARNTSTPRLVMRPSVT